MVDYVKDILWSMALIIGIPFYLYVIVRMLTSAACRSFYETRNLYKQ